ncbi:unnamed protein product [Rotaria magnacalcarata]|uniref:DYW domain-containing protein n=1 Tax=Rotaria magnacalcarata TaxID=392030 RepID=A0A8S2MDP7_9BILA|nr:unnamed protein product [Rotaria magnacalcarata]CAF3948241.1 unnamed protein product [Rotaria magnacalcarata]
MQYFRRFSLIRSTFRFISSVTVDVNPSTAKNELNEINKLMIAYNTTETPIRTVALFEWMLNIINLKPDFNCYLNIIRACGELDNINVCKKIQQFIENDRTLQINEYHQLQIKLIYMYAKVRNIEQAEKIFQKVKSTKGIPIDVSLFGTMFKGYNMNGQSNKTIELYENEILNKKTIELDVIAATCVLAACSDCQRLDIGEYIHDEVLRLDLLNPPNLRLATAIMNMYCNCGSIDRAQELFNQSLPIADRIAYTSLMKTYLSINQPTQVLRLFEQSKSSSIKSDPIFYLNVINASNQLGLMNQAENIHRSTPSHMIAYSLLLVRGLIDMHSHCLHLTEAHRLFSLLEQKDNNSLASLLHGYAINGQGQQALNLFEKVSILARASLFDEVESFIHQNKSRLQNTYDLWSAVFIVCYHSKNVEYAKSIYDKIIDDPFLSLLFADMTNSVPSNEIINYFRQEKPGKCWTEIKHDDKSNYIIHEFQDNQLSENSELNTVINELKSVDVHWKTFENDLKELFCGHTATRLAIAKNLMSTPPNTTIQLTKTKSTCHLCHEGIKQLSVLKKRDIILRDNVRVHHFHSGKCSCRDQF